MQIYELFDIFRNFARNNLKKQLKMSFISKLFGKKEEEQKAGGMEDFMTLIRVYFQAVMAADLGITNLAALPDLRVFKATLKVGMLPKTVYIVSSNRSSISC